LTPRDGEKKGPVGSWPTSDQAAAQISPSI